MTDTLSPITDEMWQLVHDHSDESRLSHRQFVMDEDYYWGPLDGETQLEIEWDKARLDAAELFGATVIQHGVDKVDVSGIAAATSETVRNDLPTYDAQGSYAIPSSIQVFNYGMLQTMLGRIVGFEPDGMLRDIASEPRNVKEL